MSEWSGDERRALERAVQRDVAYLRRRVRLLSAAVSGLTIALVAVTIGNVSTWISVQHSRSEGRSRICATVDETRSVFSDFISQVDPTRHSYPLQRLKARLDAPACGDTPSVR